MKSNNSGRAGSEGSRVLVVVDESNVSGSVRNAGRDLDWLKLRDFLAGPNSGRELIEMVVYVGLPPATVSLSEERERKSKFVHWLRANGFMVVTKDGAPTDEGRYKANVDIMMAIDVLDLSIEMQPDVVILVTGDADFAHLVTKLRRRGIRVEVASVAQHLGQMLKSAANHVIELEPLFRTFEPMSATDGNRQRLAQQTRARPRPPQQPASSAAPAPQRQAQQQPLAQRPPQQRSPQQQPGAQHSPQQSAPRQRPERPQVQPPAPSNRPQPRNQVQPQRARQLQPAQRRPGQVQRSAQPQRRPPPQTQRPQASGDSRRS